MFWVYVAKIISVIHFLANELYVIPIVNHTASAIISIARLTGYQAHRVVFLPVP